MNFWNRIGSFFLLIGIILLFMFIFSDVAGSVQFTYLLFSGLMLFTGIIMKATHPNPPSEPSQRFKALREQSQKREAQKKKQKR